MFITFGDSKTRPSTWTLEIYCPLQWTDITLAHLASRDYAAFVPVNERDIMIIGGWIDREASCIVEIFNFIEKVSRHISPLNIARGEHGACAVGEVVVVCGGLDNSNRTLNSCEVFLPFESRWKMLPSMKKARRQLAIVSLPDNRVISTGGCYLDGIALGSVESTFLSIDEHLNIAPSVWITVASMREARYGHAALYFEGKVIVAGGMRNDEMLTSVEFFTPPSNRKKSGQWISILERMYYKRSHFPLVLSADGIYAFGNVSGRKHYVARLPLTETLEKRKAHSIEMDGEAIMFREWEDLDNSETVDYIWAAVPLPKSLMHRISNFQ